MARNRTTKPARKVISVVKPAPGKTPLKERRNAGSWGGEEGAKQEKSRGQVGGRGVPKRKGLNGVWPGLSKGGYRLFGKVILENEGWGEAYVDLEDSDRTPKNSQTANFHDKGCGGTRRTKGD